METTYTIHLPENLLQSMNQNAGDIVADMSRDYAVKLYGLGKISLEQAAQLSNLSIYEFASFLTLCGVAVIDYPGDDLEAELKNISSGLI